MTDAVDKFNRTVRTYVHPQTYPVGIRFLRGAEALPEAAKLPGDFGAPLSLCQGISLARYCGHVVALKGEGQACPVADAVLCRSKTQAGGALDAVVVAPLERCSFAPDVVLCYGLPSQISLLVEASAGKHRQAASPCVVHSTCVGEVAETYREGCCNVFLPSAGERCLALTSDDELAFALPLSMLEQVADGLENSDTAERSGSSHKFSWSEDAELFPEYYS